MEIDLEEIERQANVIDERRDTVYNALGAAYSALYSIRETVQQNSASSDASSTSLCTNITELAGLQSNIQSKILSTITNLQTEMLNYVSETRANEETLSSDLFTSAESMQDVMNTLNSAFKN